MIEIMGYLGISLLVAIWSLVCVHVGFRAGRIVINKPLPPIIKDAPSVPMAEDDPYRVPMYGADAKSKPTLVKK